MNNRLYIPSVDLTPRGASAGFEIDFVWMLCRHHGRRGKSAIILGECKDQFKGINQVDIDNLRRTAAALPDRHFSVCVLLAKLGQFTPEEVALARTLNGEHESRVIMLTARELDPYHIFERTGKEFDINEYAVSPEDMAAVTAKIYF